MLTGKPVCRGAGRRAGRCAWGSMETGSWDRARVLQGASDVLACSFRHLAGALGTFYFTQFTLNPKAAYWFFLIRKQWDKYQEMWPRIVRKWQRNSFPFWVMGNNDACSRIVAELHWIPGPVSLH